MGVFTVLAFPTEEEGKRIAAEWVKEGRTGKIVVITERENVGEEISSILGTQRLRIRVKECDREGTDWRSGVLYTSREAESEGGDDQGKVSCGCGFKGMRLSGGVAGM